MIEFAPIVAAAMTRVHEIAPVGVLQEEPPATIQVAKPIAYEVAPSFVLEPAIPGRSKPTRSRNKFIGPPPAPRITAPEEVQFTLGLEALLS